MSTFDYTKSQAVALKLLNKFGTSIKVGGVKTVGVFTQPEAVLPTNQAGAGGTLLSIPQTDKVVIIPGTIKREPQVGDSVESDKSTWKVIRVNNIKPGDETIIYKLEVTQ